MRQSKTILFSAICLGLMLPWFANAAEPSSSHELLAQYVADLQKAPEDQALRERIIRLVLTLTPSPAVPAEANRLFVKATIFQQEASDIQGYDQLAMSARDFAISAYKQALLIAPWWPEAYYGLSKSLEASGRLNEAVAALNLYVITKPNAAGASAAEDRLRAIAIAMKVDKASIKP
jgi:tetratricopeptide (TPR) repeat protein